LLFHLRYGIGCNRSVLDDSRQEAAMNRAKPHPFGRIP